MTTRAPRRVEFPGQISAGRQRIEDASGSRDGAVAAVLPRDQARPRVIIRDAVIVAFLKVTKGPLTGQCVELSDRTILGRHPSSQIVLDDGAVSRQHVEITRDGECFVLADLQSRNGTEINGIRVSDPQELKDGDVIRVCDHTFQYLLSTRDGARRRLFLGDQIVTPGQRTLGEDDDSRPTAPQPIPNSNPGEGSSVLSSLEASSTGRVLRINVRPEVKLRAILEISAALGRVLDQNEVLSILLKSLFKIFTQADAGFVLLRDPETDRLTVSASLCQAPNDDEVPISMTVVRQAMDQTQAILSADVMGDRRFRNSESLTDLRLRSLMCAPLLSSDGQALGVIQLSTLEAAQPFNSDDLDLLVNVSAQAAMAVENSILHDTIVRQRDVERDLSFAAQVQQGFLPSSAPLIPGFQFAHYYKSAYDVGGDYFDYVPLSGGRVAMAIGDVAGKGVSAALLMARLHASARYHLISTVSAGAAMTSLNAEIGTSGLGFRLITLVFAVLDPATRTVTLVNAGHLPPVRRNAAGETQLIGMKQSGLPLGVLPDQQFNELTITLEPGEYLVFYTDGITEAMNPKEEMYGRKRLQATVESAAPSADALVSELVESVFRFCGAAAQRDDICVTALGCVAASRE